MQSIYLVWNTFLWFPQFGGKYIWFGGIKYLYWSDRFVFYMMSYAAANTANFFLIRERFSHVFLFRNILFFRIELIIDFRKNNIKNMLKTWFIPLYTKTFHINIWSRFLISLSVRFFIYIILFLLFSTLMLKKNISVIILLRRLCL